MEEVSEKITRMTGNYYFRRRFFRDIIMIEVEDVSYPHARFYRKAKPEDVVELIKKK